MTKMVTKCDDKNMKLTKPIGSLHNASYLWDVVCHKSRYRCMLMRTYKITVCRSLKIKASGGISNLKECINMIEAGASKIGTSKAHLIIKEKK